MTRDSTALLAEALKLAPPARARLAADLLRSLEEADEVLEQTDYDAAWGDVIERRSKEMADGTVVPVPWPEARRRIAGDE